MSVLFNHAILLEQGRNPIHLVRQSAKRQRIADWLEPEELTVLLSQLDPCFRLMVFPDDADRAVKCWLELQVADPVFIVLGKAEHWSRKT
jgi:hypothetical protein